MSKTLLTFVMSDKGKQWCHPIKPRHHDYGKIYRALRKLHTPQSGQRQGKQLFLAHGDGLVPQDFMTRLPKDIQKRIRRFMHLRAFFHSPLPQFLYRLLPPACGDMFGYEWARRSRLKEMKHPFPYKGDDKEELVLWANEHKQYDLCVFGHRHVTLHLRREALPDVVILGDFFQQCTYAQMKDGQIEIKQLHD